jgi:G3E family GTPase
MNRPLAVTFIGGFPGAGKTSSLHHFISGHPGGHLAVIVDSAAPPNQDAKALAGLCGTMGRLHDSVKEMPPGDLATQRAWLTNTLRDLTLDNRFERVLVEVAGTTHPARLAPAMEPAAVQQIVCLVDALDFHRSAVAPGAPSPFLDFQLAQIAGATLLVLNKCDLVDASQRTACIERLAVLNPTANWIETAYGELPAEVWARTATPPQLSAAMESPRERSSPTPEGPALSSLLYRAHRPFHPKRFWAWFNAEHPGLLRVKGIIWLATRNLLVGGISRTRWQNSCGGAGVWWAALPREDWPADPAALARMQETWREPYGDRRQEIVLLGEATRLPDIARRLGDCLLGDDDFAQPPAAWRNLPDPFPAWDVGDDA